MKRGNLIQDVNIGLGDEVSGIFYAASKLTHKNRPGFLVELHKSFSGFRAIPGSVLKDVDNLYFNLGFDGVGTKVEIAERLGDHSAIAHDLFAMVCDDAVVRGAEPVAIGSILDIWQLDESQNTLKAIKQLAKGYVEAAEKAGVVIVNGEVAELGDRVGGHGNFNYNWGATVLWIGHKSRVLTGLKIKPGDALIGLKENGFRSNGITDVRKAMLEHYGPKWQNVVVTELGNKPLGRLVQKPSVIYCKFIAELTGGYDIDKKPTAKIHGTAHITGGGQPSKLGRMLEPSGLGVIIDNPIEPPEIMKHVQILRNFSDKEAYGKWHMGPGMVIVTPEPDKVLRQAKAFGIEAKKMGKVTKHPGIHIKNCGAVQKEEWLKF